MKIQLVTVTRNKKGQVARTEQAISVDFLRIGRGADCALHLPDPRVALHHASIRSAENGALYIDATDGLLMVDGSFERSSRLEINQQIVLGPYEIAVLPASADVDLALSLELADPLKDSVAEVRGNVRAGLGRTWLSKRLFGAFGFILILAVFLAWPIYNATAPGGRAMVSQSALTPDASWDVGTLSSAHANFGRDCGNCHQQPFVQVKNNACEDCHQRIGWHFPLDEPAARAVHERVFPGARCAACHRDHKGENGLVRTDSSLCTDCHRDLTQRHPQSASPNISDFARDHPAFKLSILQPGKLGPGAIERVPMEDRKQAVENSGLKFPHDLHLNKKGVRGPQGRITLDCANCHTPDEAGLRFKPTTMKEHCQACHSLEFEPKVTSRQVPHDRVEKVMTAVTEFYAQAALTDTPIDVVLDAASIRQPARPGERVSDVRRQAALTWATDKAEKITREIFEVRVCFQCHQITPVAANGTAPATWQIAPVAITQHWLPKSRFPHRQHNTTECGKCHEVGTSKTSADIAIPGINNCRGCHGGNERTRDKARGTCETCHGFHTGSHKAGVPVIIPGRSGLANTADNRETGGTRPAEGKP